MANKISILRKIIRQEILKESNPMLKPGGSRKYTPVEQLKNEIDKDGFDYAVIQYSDWDDINDEVFQKLRDQYITAADKLEKYIKKMK